MRHNFNDIRCFTLIIPVSVRDYILTVSSTESIDDVSLEDINSFLFNLESHLKGDLKSG